LISQPELLLLDEPAAGLDLSGREDLLLALTRLAEMPQSPAMILVTHHVEQIPAGFTDLALMRQGRLTVTGQLSTVMTSQNLSQAFDRPLAVTQVAQRWTARAA
ncbi:MAG: ABC transporter ATP-binding protein, partial [Bifidobacteriaceae bacterium]|jgi:iron complex transport system ATP-binding protein|nr:ABC transporter ATP-binding protein [Bifidobacteriaceae bacterium]